ncbi:MAG: hypothetical protein K2G64_06180, partial [Muribaculaceae bacterium]|nr:hypothetical protein [Muribaculaceae bacterium]
RGNLGFDCDDEYKVNGKNIFRLGAATTATERKLIIEPNPQVTIADLEDAGKTEGSVRCYIIAGNIKKYITVNYRLQGYFEVTPSNIKIQDGDNSTDADHVFEYNTNLGAFTITSENLTTWSLKSSSTTPTEHKFADSSFKLTIDGDNSSGKIYITEVNYPTTTEIHSFIFTPDNSTYESYATSASVDVMSSKDKYRVYFRAINDYQSTDGQMDWDVPAEFTGTGSYNDNWIDWWNRTGDGKEPQGEYHKIYAYTQYGEEANTMPVWQYTGPWGESTTITYEKSNTDVENLNESLYGERINHMIGDASNPGWYYYDIPVFCKGNYIKPGTTDATDDQKKKYGNGPLPGATLMIFYNDAEDVYTRHRVMQNDEPGIPLGDDNDNETWVLYDPTRDPVYNVYNDKPRISNVTYTIYSDIKMTTWENKYGKNNNVLSGYLTDASSSLTAAQRNAGYNYKYTVVFKAPAGEYDKNITVTCQPSSNNGVYVVLDLSGESAANLAKWGTPCVEIQEPKSLQTMTPITGKANQYYWEIPSEYQAKSDIFKFCSSDYGISWNNWKLFGSPSQSGAWVVTANDYTKQPVSYLNLPTGGSTVTSTYLMGGGNFSTGYFKNNRWYRTMQN